MILKLFVMVHLENLNIKVPIKLLKFKHPKTHFVFLQMIKKLRILSNNGEETYIDIP